MMDGVTILSATEVATEYIYSWGVFSWILFLIFATVGAAVIVIAFDYEDSEFFVVGVISIALGILFGVLARDCEVVETIPEYKVIIEDSVSLTESLNDMTS